MSSILTAAERLKFHLFAEGLAISEAARKLLRERNGLHRLSPADFASTSGVILQLDDDVWVNAPISDFNPNFVTASRLSLDSDDDGFVVRGLGLESRAAFWLSPSYHGQLGADGRPLNNYVFTHADRVRLSPIQGCGMTCKFCNIPYEDRYGTKSVDAMLAALRRALGDDVQPGRHVLISGGTPKLQDHDYLRSVYASVLESFPEVDIDVMMVPVAGLLDVRELALQGVHQLSINIEIFDDTASRKLMPQKYRQGVENYLDFIADAAVVLGPGRVRSMLMVGLESTESTLSGVRAIIERGGVPVLSPFRPDPATPLRRIAPPDATVLQDAYLRASELANAAGTPLGPDCSPCAHNTLTLSSQSGASRKCYPTPRLL
jgi:hypothetical protein